MISDATKTESITRDSEAIKVTDVTCAACGITCDDVEITMTAGSIDIRNACVIGDVRFQGLHSGERIVHPTVNGRQSSWGEAIGTAAEILVKAKRPLIFLGGGISTEAMAAGIELAEQLGGLVDGNTSLCHGPTLLGHQSTGQVTCTLGECRNRSDLAIFWGCNPADSHPRHMSKHSLYPRGFFTVQGGKARKTIVVDPRRTPTAALADLHVQLKPGMDHELMDALMVRLQGERIDGWVEDITGVSIETIDRMVEMIKACRFGVIWVGLGLASTRGKLYNAAAAMRLTQVCNSYTKFVLLANRVNGNDAGLNQVLSWTSGYPFAVDYSRGYARYQPGEYSCVDALSRGETDAALVVGEELAANLPMMVVKRLMDMPVISIAATPGPQAFVSDVILPEVLDGMECEGTFYRMDNVPIQARSFTRSPYDFTASNEDTLRQLLNAVKLKKTQKKRGW